MVIFSDCTRLKLNVAFLVLVMITTVLHVMVKPQYIVEMDKGLVDKALKGYAFRNLTMKSIVECFLACMEDCLCMSFQMCGQSTECQLLSSNHFLSPLAMKSMMGCSYYDIVQAESEQVSSRFPATSCIPGCECLLNPCQNGGRCVPIVPKHHSNPRYKCDCSPGYAGNLCQVMVRSCRGYINGSRVSANYTVFDNHMNPFTVFCDFDSNSTMAWTLIQSYQLRHTVTFQNKSFKIDLPIHESSPRWDKYRLSRSRMQSIQADSSKWRLTCRYDTDGLVYRDYIQASVQQLDIMTFNNDSCILVERADIRGYYCYQCTVHLVQHALFALHCDSYFTCELKPSHSLACTEHIAGEDNFGVYKCINPNHRCSSHQTATTQTWFGGD